MKEFIKKIPYVKTIFNVFYVVVFKRIELIYLGLYTTARTLRHSNSTNNLESWKVSMRVSCHILEKGLTMPEKRLGFGQERVSSMAHKLLLSKSYTGVQEVETAVGIIKEYDRLHKQEKYSLPTKLQYLIDSVSKLYPEFRNLNQINLSRDAYFASTTKSFSTFAQSRRSIRNFSKKASDQQISDSFGLALNAPAACNRQIFKCHVFSDKEKVQEILSQQNGNRGFGHLVPQVCVLTVDLRMMGKNEQNDVYFNAGLFAMNLCYSFHFNKVGSCMLNWAASPGRDKLLRKVANIPNEESITVIIAFGIPSDQLEIARSHKKKLEDAIVFH
jgi:nitroreductase